MFQSFLSALVYDMLGHVSKHPDFFEQKESARESALDGVKIPKHFKSYLATVSEDDFLKDLKLIPSFAQGEWDASMKKSALLLALLDFLTGPLAIKLDQLAGDFYVMKEEDREKVVAALIKGDSASLSALRELILHRTPQELAAAIQKLASTLVDAPLILVQSPREMNQDLKKEVRQALLDKHPRSFPSFQINRKLIGGMRIFENGDVTDHSWLHRVLRFTHLTTV